MLVEKYRPKHKDEIVGQDEIINSIWNVIKRGDLPHFLFVGSSGCGKTSTAQCMARSIFGEGWRQYYMEFNASDERGIDVIRGKIKNLARIKGKRIVFLDEADNLTYDAMMSLRRIMETTKGTTFILSANHEYKIIDAIKSRCAIYRFKRLDDKVIEKKIIDICKAEGIKVESNSPEEKSVIKEGLTQLVKEADGDLRKAINTLEKIVGSNKVITAKDVLSLRRPEIAGDALKQALSGNFEVAKERLEEAYIQNGFDSQQIISEFYRTIDNLSEQEAKREVKLRLYIKLAELENRCKVGSNALIQIMGFLSYVWLVPHLDTKCPIGV
jgi:replication factor C small subunit